MVKFLIFDTCADAILAALPAGAADDAMLALLLVANVVATRINSRSVLAQPDKA